MNKRTYYLIVCIVCIVCMISFCSIASGEQTIKHFNLAGFDGEESTVQWEGNDFFSRMEKRTGILFSFHQYNKRAEWQQAKDAMFSSGELPDVLFKADLSTDELIRYTDSGQLLDLKPLLQQCAPSLWALLEENPHWMSAITLPNGKIGALPYLNTLPTQNAMWINQQWLDALGLAMPTDADSLAETLLAFAQEDPNKNGKKDEVPLTFLGVWDLKFLGHAFGFASNDYNLYVDDTGIVQFAPLQEEYMQFLSYLHELFKQKLLDQNGFYMSDVFRTSTEQDAPAVYGVFFGPNPLTVVTFEQSSQYVLLEPLTCAGKKVYRDLGLEVVRGTFAITSACKDPAALLAWVDVLYTQEGAIQAMVGTEGEHYIVDEEGRWEWSDAMGGVSGGAAGILPSSVTVHENGDMPWLFPLEFYNRFFEPEVGRINEELLKLQAFIREPFPSTYSLTSQQRAQVLLWQDKLGKYIDESFASFVLGQQELTAENMEVFRINLLERNAQEMVTFWQELFDGM